MCHTCLWINNKANIVGLTFLLPDQPKPSPLLFYCLTPDDFTRQWRASGWERVNKKIFSGRRTMRHKEGHSELSLKNTIT